MKDKTSKPLRFIKKIKKCKILIFLMVRKKYLLETLDQLLEILQQDFVVFQSWRENFQKAWFIVLSV